MGLLEWVIVLIALLVLMFAHVPPLLVAIAAVVGIILAIAWRSRPRGP